MENNSGLKGKVIATVLLVALFSAVTWFVAMKMICSDISVSAKKQYAAHALEDGQVGFPASMFLSDEEAQQLLDDASVPENMSDSVNDCDGDLEGIELKLVSGYTYSGKMLIVKDPSRVKLSTIYPWQSVGVELDELVKSADAVAGINGGLYFQLHNSGGHPTGVAVCEGEIQYNIPGIRGLHLIGMDNDDRLRIIDLTGMKAADVEKLVKEEGIRDAITFPDEYRANSNWFVKILGDGKQREVKDPLNCCINPRTVIGQRADGAVLLLAVTGRGTSGHFGATCLDVVRIMKDFGAVTAGNLDGGSSTCLYYNGRYEQPSATFYYAKGSWRLPTAFVVSKK